MSKIAEQKGLEAYPKSDFHRVETRRRNERSHYIKGYDQALQDFLEKAEEFFKKEFYMSVSKQICCKNVYNTIKNFVEQFKNYIQDEM